MLALESCVRRFWDSDQLHPEKIVVPALTSSPCTVERRFALLAVCFISSDSVTLQAPPISHISPGRKMLLRSLYFAFNEMTRLVLEMQCAVCQLKGRNVSGPQRGEGSLAKLVQLLSVHIISVCSERAEICAPAGPVYGAGYLQGKFSATVICQIGEEGPWLVAVFRDCITPFAYFLS